MTEIRAKYSLESNQSLYRRINRRFFWLMVGTLTIYGAFVVCCFFVFGFKPAEALAACTIVFQFMVAGWGLAFIGAYFMRAERKMDIGIELGILSAENVSKLNERLDKDKLGTPVKGTKDEVIRSLGTGKGEL